MWWRDFAEKMQHQDTLTLIKFQLQTGGSMFKDEFYDVLNLVGPYVFPSENAGSLGCLFRF
jgi:hypothetical protein